MKNEIAIDTVNTENKRLIGLDILKILSMFFILIHHFSKHGGFYANATGFSQTIIYILNILFLPSVNIFVFVSAYLIVKKNSFKLRRLLYLYLQIVFFAIFTYLFSLLITKQSFSVTTLFQCLDPFNNFFWFTNSYMFLYVLTPLLLLIVNKLNKKAYLILIYALLLVTIFSTYTSFWPFLNKGFSGMWFVFLFLFAGYIAKFDIGFKKWVWIVLYAISLVISYFCFPETIANPVYTTLSTIISTVSLFNIFKDITIKNKFLTKTIQLVVSCTLGIYLLHDSHFIQQILYSKIINTPYFYTRPTSILWFFLFIIATFIVCLLFDVARKYVCKLFLKIIEKIKDKNKNEDTKKDTV